MAEPRFIRSPDPAHSSIVIYDPNNMQGFDSSIQEIRVNEGMCKGSEISIQDHKGELRFVIINSNILQFEIAVLVQNQK